MRHINNERKSCSFQWSRIQCALISRRSQHGNVQSQYLAGSFRAYFNVRADYSGHLRRKRTISLSQYAFKFYFLTNSYYVYNSGIAETDVACDLKVLVCPNVKSQTQGNRYSVTHVIYTYIVLRRMETLNFWRDLYLQFRKHASHLFEILWEFIEAFLYVRLSVLTTHLSEQYLSRKV